MPRVVLAMSGGVDSSVSAFLLKEHGYDVIGLFMRTGVHVEADRRADSKKGCCSAVDAGDGRRIADRLGIPFYALDFTREFDRIIDYFADEYLAGRTPNPCVVCNNWLKFGKLWSLGRQLGADFIATGHYAQIKAGPQGPELHRAVDPNKDQSYVLHGIQRAILPHLLFPVGHLPKNEVREIARKIGLSVADKPDSVEICFVPDNDHARLIRERRPERQTQGAFVDRSGRFLAWHAGYERFTIGQRKGLGYAGGSRRYVLEIVPQSRQVVLGDREDLFSKGLVAERVNWLIDMPRDPIRCQVKIRYRHEAAPAILQVRTDGQAEVTFDEPQSAITPGQVAVFYDGSRVLGGGWIAARQ
jgi:tRNA-specific 2-thiouridylase